MKRRDFLKVLAATPGVAAFSCADRQAEAERIAGQQGTLSDADLTWHKAPCRYCGTGCGVEAGVRDGKVMAVRGDEASPVNRGLLCVKGYHAAGLALRRGSADAIRCCATEDGGWKKHLLGRGARPGG